MSSDNFHGGSVTSGKGFWTIDLWLSPSIEQGPLYNYVSV